MRWITIGILSLAAFFVAAAHGDIYQWEFIDPLHPELGRQQSSTLAPDGTGRNAVPSAILETLNLSMAWLHEMDWHDASFESTVLTDADLSAANLIDADFYGATLSDADFTGAESREAGFFNVTGFTVTQLYSTASFQSGNLSEVFFGGNDLTGWGLAGQNLTDAIVINADLPHGNLTPTPVGLLTLVRDAPTVDVFFDCFELGVPLVNYSPQRVGGINY